MRRSPLPTRGRRDLVLSTGIALLVVLLSACRERVTIIAAPGQQTVINADPGRVEIAPPPKDSAFVFRALPTWSGLAEIGDGQGLSFVDADRDGALDVVVGMGQGTVVYRNRGDGSFYPLWRVDHPGRDAAFVFVADITADGIDDLVITHANALPDAAVGDGVGRFHLRPELLRPMAAAGFPSSVTFGDFTGAGRLDVYLGILGPFDALEMSEDGSTLILCEDLQAWLDDPIRGDPVGDQLLRFDPETEAFIDVTAGAGLNTPRLETQALMTVDLNDDGHLDILVGSEGQDYDRVYLGDGTGKFEEASTRLGITKRTSAMGFDAADIDGDGDLDLYITDDHPRDGGILYVQRGGKFTEEAASHGLKSTAEMTGWGLAFEDFDQDGDVDLFQANGTPFGGCVSGAQEKAFFLNDGKGQFTQVHGAPGSGIQLLTESRGLVVGDTDGDGDLDLVVSNFDAPPTALRNDLAVGHWIAFELDYPGIRPAIGSVVTIESGGREQKRWVKGTANWGGSSTQRVHFGLGEHTQIDSVTVRWPHGEVDELGAHAADQVVRIARQK